MGIKKLYLFIVLSILLTTQACEKQLQKRIIFQITGIVLDRDVVAQGQAVNITATFEITGGTTNQRSVDVIWESSGGMFEDPNRLTTVWTAPDDFTGEMKITLTASFMGHTDVADIALKVVKTPASGWGSLSGYLFTESLSPLSNIPVVASTGEADTTDGSGYFYIADLPQGSNGISFSNIAYKWATSLSPQVTIASGSHNHLGNVIFYVNDPAEISEYEQFPGHQAILLFSHENPDLVDFHELYRATDINGSGATMLTTIDPELEQFNVEEAGDNAFYALKSVPLNGETSDFSAWTFVEFINVIDPDASISFVEYVDFFNATLHWQLTGYEDYYKGFRVVQDTGSGWDNLSPLLPVSTTEFDLQTMPGMEEEYYILAISTDDLYNETQPDEQKVTLQVPGMEYPDSFRGGIYQGSDIRLLWEPIAGNNDWYDGYVLDKKIITDTFTYDWEEMVRLTSSITGSYIDEEVDTGNVYKYRISTVAYPDLPWEDAFYSDVDSISISTE